MLRDIALLFFLAFVYFIILNIGILPLLLYFLTGNLVILYLLPFTTLVSLILFYCFWVKIDEM
jgi:hypothetical protein